MTTETNNVTLKDIIDTVLQLRKKADEVSDDNTNASIELEEIDCQSGKMNSEFNSFINQVEMFEADCFSSNKSIDPILNSFSQIDEVAIEKKKCKKRYERKKCKIDKNTDDIALIFKTECASTESPVLTFDEVLQKLQYTSNSISQIENKINAARKRIDEKEIEIQKKVAKYKKLHCSSDEKMSDTSYESTIPMTRVIKKRQKISVQDRERLVNAHENGDNPIELGRMLGILNKRSIYNILHRYKKTMKVSSGKVGGHKKPMITDEIGQFLINYLDSNVSATLVEMQAVLHSKCNLRPSTQTISNYLHGKLITVKKIRDSVVDRNCERVKEVRKVYVTRYLHEGWRSNQTIYIDESLFQLWMSRRTGRSRKSQKIYKQLPNIQSPSISLLLGISKTGPIHFQVVMGSINHSIYQKFIYELSLKIPSTKHYFIHDNATIHNNTITTSPMHVIVNLPPYSPFLNPIETLFSQVKSRVRAKISNAEQYLNIPVSQQIHEMDKIITEVLSDDTLTKNIKNHYQHIKKYFPECLLKQDIL